MPDVVPCWWCGNPLRLDYTNGEYWCYTCREYRLTDKELFQMEVDRFVKEIEDLKIKDDEEE